MLCGACLSPCHGPSLSPCHGASPPPCHVEQVSPILPVSRPVLQLSPGSVDYFQGPTRGGTGGTKKGTSDISRWGSKFWQCQDCSLSVTSFLKYYHLSNSMAQVVGEISVQLGGRVENLKAKMPLTNIDLYVQDLTGPWE